MLWLVSRERKQMMDADLQRNRLYVAAHHDEGEQDAFVFFAPGAGYFYRNRP